MENLEREIRGMVSGLRGSVRTRKNHPTYGVTKADLRERLARLEGALFAFGVLDEQGAYLGTASVGLMVDRVAESLDIDVVELRSLVRNA